MGADRGLLCGHRQEQSRPRVENDQDAGRRVRRGRQFQRADRSLVVIIGEMAMPSGVFGIDAVAMNMRVGDFTALDRVELKVRPRSFHALLAANAAGKATLGTAILGSYPGPPG